MKTKEELLRNAGYRYNLYRMIYVNRSSRKVFSWEWIEDNSDDDLAMSIAEPNATDDWQFYFKEAPSSSVQNVLRAELDERPAAH